MKWMWSTAVVVAVSAAVSAQAAQKMSEPKMGDTMPMTYTGCVEAVNHGGSFVLTPIADKGQTMHDGAMMKGDGAMKDDAMMKGDGMAKKDDAMMKGDGMAKKDDGMASSSMAGDHMMPSLIVLTGRSDLKKHVGQKVTVSGTVSHGMSDGMATGRETLAVGSLKVVAKSCS